MKTIATTGSRRAHLSAWKLGLTGAGLCLVASSAVAGPRTGGPYSIATEVVDAGGGRSTGGVGNIYTNVGSLGGIAGVSTVAAPAEKAKAGYIAQLYEVTGFVVSASPSTVDESATRQLGAAQLLDDATELAVNPALVTWDVLSGPIASISAGGLATAGTVYQHTAASVRGTYLGSPSPFTLTVLNVNPDDFGSYAGDQLDDDWQVQYFGQNNPLAAPAVDPDKDGQNNLFEFTAGLDPTDPNSFFKLRIEKAAPPSEDQKLIFGPRFDDRTYTVQFRDSLSIPPTWAPLGGTSQSDNGQERTVIDPHPIGKKFYEIKITKP